MSANEVVDEIKLGTLTRTLMVQRELCEAARAFVEDFPSIFRSDLWRRLVNAVDNYKRMIGER